MVYKVFQCQHSGLRDLRDSLGNSPLFRINEGDGPRKLLGKLYYRALPDGIGAIRYQFRSCCIARINEAESAFHRDLAETLSLDLDYLLRGSVGRRHDHTADQWARLVCFSSRSADYWYHLRHLSYVSP